MLAKDELFSRAPLLGAENYIAIWQKSAFPPDRVTFLGRAQEKAIRVVDRYRPQPDIRNSD